MVPCLGLPPYSVQQALASSRVLNQTVVGGLEAGGATEKEERVRNTACKSHGIGGSGGTPGYHQKLYFHGSKRSFPILLMERCVVNQRATKPEGGKAASRESLRILALCHCPAV